ncbi:MAG: hypothetical protein CTY12_00520 [Methylotenera sp.]|nr:MAG: hypothetical protein CTY12_00520 [Methylotenera sp.]
MRAVKKPYPDCMDEIDPIFAHLLVAIQQHVPIQYRFELRDLIECTMDSIDQNPNGDPNMEWDDCNNRYGYQHTIPGLTAEIISAVNLITEYNFEFLLATEQHDQTHNTIDFWIGNPTANQSVQVKSVIFQRDKLINESNLRGIKSDWVSLVDIDDYHHFWISNALLQKYLTERVDLTFDLLKSSSTKYFHNVHMYGTKTDRQIANKVST